LKWIDITVYFNKTVNRKKRSFLRTSALLNNLDKINKLVSYSVVILGYSYSMSCKWIQRFESLPVRHYVLECLIWHATTATSCSINIGAIDELLWWENVTCFCPVVLIVWHNSWRRKCPTWSSNIYNFYCQWFFF